MTYVALVRGVNVGGHKSLAMSDLRAAAAELRFTGVRSWLQSGNLVFAGSRQPASGIEQTLETCLAKQYRLSADVFVRSIDEWSALIAGNPFPAEAERDPAHLLVMLLKDVAGPAKVRGLKAAITGREVLHATGRHAYLLYPDGIGRSRLTHTLIERQLGTRGTARNWNTAMKLGSLAASLGEAD